MHDKSAKHEFLIKASPDQDIEHSVNSKSEISLQRGKPAEIAVETGLLRKINSCENERRERNADDECARPAFWSLQSDISEVSPRSRMSSHATATSNIWTAPPY